MYLNTSCDTMFKINTINVFFISLDKELTIFGPRYN